jgi:hypothetical protein
MLCGCISQADQRPDSEVSILPFASSRVIPQPAELTFSRLRNQHELNAKLEGATLGDAEADVDDTLKWLKRAKKREKELAKKRQQELENMDKMYQEEYSESGHHQSVQLVIYTDTSVPFRGS